MSGDERPTSDYQFMVGADQEGNLPPKVLERISAHLAGPVGRALGKMAGVVAVLIGEETTSTTLLVRQIKGKDGETLYALETIISGTKYLVPLMPQEDTE